MTTVIRTWLDPYPINRCPHCGHDLDAPDAELTRRCPHCRYTVLPATVTLESDP